METAPAGPIAATRPCCTTTVTSDRTAPPTVMGTTSTCWIASVSDFPSPGGGFALDAHDHCASTGSSRTPARILGIRWIASLVNEPMTCMRWNLLFETWCCLVQHRNRVGAVTGARGSGAVGKLVSKQA